MVCRGTIEERILEVGTMKMSLDEKVSKTNVRTEKELLKFIKKKRWSWINN